ncbi:hypothetical protein FRB94_013245 [Tulasnella sp. JGI-2019a]|nr:hypothetical protein FRB94_013245 [Tulasnella sp. JGI-2019a]
MSCHPSPLHPLVNFEIDPVHLDMRTSDSNLDEDQPHQDSLFTLPPDFAKAVADTPEDEFSNGQGSDTGEDEDEEWDVEWDMEQQWQAEFVSWEATQGLDPIVRLGAAFESEAADIHK